MSKVLHKKPRGKRFCFYTQVTDQCQGRSMCSVKQCKKGVLGGILLQVLFSAFCFSFLFTLVRGAHGKGLGKVMGELEWTSRTKDSRKSKLWRRTSRQRIIRPKQRDGIMWKVRNRANLDSSSPTGGTKAKREITLTWALHQLLWGGSLFPNHTKGHFLPHHLQKIEVGMPFTLLILESSELLNVDLHTIIIFP